VRPEVHTMKLVKYCLALGLVLVLLLPAAGWGEVRTVGRDHQFLYPDPDFASKPIMAVPAGADVNVENQVGDWYKVTYQGKSGWINRQAFLTLPPSSGFNLGGLLFGTPVKQTSSDEVALAGKGFTPEVESSYRAQHPEMKYGLVDQIESHRVAPATLQAFIKEGDLKP
jgi:uncharacterized protein YgiM (DUF1202 family)